MEQTLRIPAAHRSIPQNDICRHRFSWLRTSPDRRCEPGFRIMTVVRIKADSDAGRSIQLTAVDDVRRPSAARIFSATRAASLALSISGSRITNSSPPWRLTVSISRNVSRKRLAAAFSKASPMACPCESLIDLSCPNRGIARQAFYDAAHPFSWPGQADRSTERGLVIP